MSDEEKCHADLIEDIIVRKMKPLYWIIGVPLAIMVTIFVTVSLPISAKIIENTKDIENKADKEDIARDYLTKGNYLYLQRQSHNFDIEAIRNPSNADLIYNKEVNTAGETLGFISRSATTN